MKLNINVFDPYNQTNTFDKVYDIPTYPTDEQSQWYWAQRVRADMPISAPYNRKDDIMKVTRKQPEAEPLSFLEYGDVFEFHNNIYMLINNNEVRGASHRSCVNLSKGEMSYICKDVLVIPHYTAELKY